MMTHQLSLYLITAFIIAAGIFHHFKTRPLSARRLPSCFQAPPGECAYCDRERLAGNTFFPPHTPSPQCESGKRPHCSCDACF